MTSTRQRLKSFFNASPGDNLIKGSGGTFLAKVLGTGLTFMFHVGLSRILGPTAYGDYVYVLTWVNILALFGLCGFGTASLRFIAVFKGKEQWDLFNGFVRISAISSVAVSITVMVILGGALWLLSERIPVSLLDAFLAGILLLPIFGFFNLLLAQLRGLKRPIAAELLFTSLRPVLVIAAICLYLYGLNAGGATAANAVACEIMAVCLLVFIAVKLRKTALPHSVFKGPVNYRNREWFAVAFPLMLLSIFHMINSRADILVIGFFCESADVAVYNAANKIATLASFGLIAINNVLAPMIAQLHAQEEHGKLQRTVKLSAWASIVFCAPVIVGILLLEPYLFGLFGPSYLAGDLPLKILLVCQLLNILAGPVGILLTMTTQHRMATKLMGMSAIVNVVLNFGFVPRFGIVGAAAATSLSTLTWNVAMLILVVNRLKINPTIFYLRTMGNIEKKAS